MRFRGETSQFSGKSRESLQKLLTEFSSSTEIHHWLRIRSSQRLLQIVLAWNTRFHFLKVISNCFSPGKISSSDLNAWTKPSNSFLRARNNQTRWKNWSLTLKIFFTIQLSQLCLSHRKTWLLSTTIQSSTLEINTTSLRLFSSQRTRFKISCAISANTQERRRKRRRPNQSISTSFWILRLKTLMSINRKSKVDRELTLELKRL